MVSIVELSHCIRDPMTKTGRSDLTFEMSGTDLTMGEMLKTVEVEMMS